MVKIIGIYRFFLIAAQKVVLNALIRVLCQEIKQQELATEITLISITIAPRVYLTAEFEYLLFKILN